MHIVIVDTSYGHWHTLYIDGKWVSHGHHIDDQHIVAVLNHLGHDVQFNYETMTKECSDKYEGSQLPQDINDLDFQ